MSRLAVCPAPSHLVPVAKGWGGGRARGVRPPGLARLVPRGLEEVLPWRRHAPHPLPGPGSRAPCLWFSPLPTTPAPAPSLALQPRSCIAPWRPSSALSQVPKCRGCPRQNRQELGGPTWLRDPAPSCRGAGAVTPAQLRFLQRRQRPLLADAPVSSPPTSLSPGGFRVTGW